MNARGKLHRKVGCEWTWQTRGQKTSITWMQAVMVRNHLDRNKVRYYKPPQIDDYCLEIPTPPCSTLLELGQYWESYHAAIKPLGLIRHSVGRTSGGGHIHVDCLHTRAGLLLAKKAVAWSYLNPWIGWVFNDPVDDESAKSPENFAFGMIEFLSTMHTHDSFSYWSVFSRASNYDKHTIEFRALDMPKTWGEAERHIRFVDALVERIDGMGLARIDIAVELHSSKKVPLAKALAARWPYERSAPTFEKLVRDLKLPWEHYEPYLRNLRQRYKLGTTN